MTKPMTVENLLAEIDTVTTPIDYDHFVAEGVLERAGSWWRVLKPHRLPKYASKQATAIKVVRGVLCYQFISATQRKSLTKISASLRRKR